MHTISPTLLCLALHFTVKVKSTLSHSTRGHGVRYKRSLRSLNMGINASDIVSRQAHIGRDIDKNASGLHDGVSVISIASTSSSARLLTIAGFEDLTSAEALVSSHMNALQQHPFALIFTFVSLASVVSVIYASRGVFIVASIIAYITALSLMSVLVRRIYTLYSFDYPQFITATHFLSTSIVGFSMLGRRWVTAGTPIRVPALETFALGIGPVAVANALSIGFANMGLLYCNAHFYEMLSAQSVLVTAGVGVAMGKPFSSELVPPLLTISFGLLVVTFGEFQCSTLGAVCISLAVLFRAAKVQIQRLLMSDNTGTTKFDPIELVAWSSFACFVIMAVWSMAVDGTAPLVGIMSFPTAQAVMLSAAAAVVLNTTALFVLKELGPVAQQGVGQFKGAIATVIAVVVLGEKVSKQEVIGYGIVVVAICWFNKVDQSLKASNVAAEK